MREGAREKAIWVLCDGKPGHENQSLGLAEAVGRLVDVTFFRISVAGCGLLGGIRKVLRSGSELPRPDLILGAGHATHAALALASWRFGAPSVVLMKPSLPMIFFDLCILPEHDLRGGAEDHDRCSNDDPESGRVVITNGALNRVVPGAGERTGKFILVGGPSKTHDWDEEGVLGMLAKATDRGGWEMSDSRRTPDGFLDRAEERLPGVRMISHRETPENWIPEKLGSAKEVWVTEDSISMIYEALTGGARVGLLPLPRRKGKGARVLRGIDTLTKKGYVTPFEKWLELGTIDFAPETLHEADRCAEIVIRKFFQ